jgi:hypothetical protein
MYTSNRNEPPFQYPSSGVVVTNKSFKSLTSSQSILHVSVHNHQTMCDYETVSSCTVEFDNWRKPTWQVDTQILDLFCEQFHANGRLRSQSSLAIRLPLTVFFYFLLQIDHIDARTGTLTDTDVGVALACPYISSQRKDISLIAVENVWSQC